MPQHHRRALVPRQYTVKISDITIRTLHSELLKAFIKLEWGGETVWCSHRPKKPLECHNIDGKTNDNFKFHIEFKDGWIGANQKGHSDPEIFVSRQDVVHSFRVHIKECHPGFTKVCFPWQRLSLTRSLVRG